MKVTEKTKIYLAVVFAVIFIASLVYNLSIDPRSMYEKGESPREELEQQDRIRDKEKPVDENRDSFLRMDLLNNRKILYESNRGKNIFSLNAPNREVSKPVTKLTPVVRREKPVVTPQPPERKEFEPFTYMGLALAKGKKIAIIEDKRNSKIYLAYEDGYLNKDEFLVKEITAKKVVLVRLSNKVELEIKR